MPAEPWSHQDQSISASGKHIVEQGRGLTQVEGRERAGGGGPGREDHGPGPQVPGGQAPPPTGGALRQGPQGAPLGSREVLGTLGAHLQAQG